MEPNTPYSCGFVTGYNDQSNKNPYHITREGAAYCAWQRGYNDGAFKRLNESGKSTGGKRK